MNKNMLLMPNNATGINFLTPRENVMREIGLIIGLTALAAAPALAADPANIDWSKVPVANVTLFYPGQSSYEWLRTSGHPGSKSVLDGQACTTCHTGMEKALGDKIVKGGPLEPTPVKGKNGTVDLKFQAAYDGKNAYLRFQWTTLNSYPGSEHQYLRFDGKEWKVYGYPKLDKVVQDGAQPGIYEDRMTIMIDDGKVPLFAQQGCWLTCHNGQRDMPKQFTNDEVKANALLTAIKKGDVRKYLPDTRNDPSDWKSGKSVEDIAKIKAAGGFVDLIQWRATVRTRSAWPMTVMFSSFAIRMPARTCSAAMRTRRHTRRSSCGTRRK
jgi:hypothetical protein